MSLSGADPLNLAGILTPGAKLAALTGNRLLFRDGLPVASLAGGDVQFLTEPRRRYPVGGAQDSAAFRLAGVARRSGLTPSRREEPMPIFSRNLPVETKDEVFTELLSRPGWQPTAMLVGDIDRHLDCLPAGQRNAVRAIAVDGASISEAAARLSMTNGAVRVALHRGLAALAAKFNGEGT